MVDSQEFVEVKKVHTNVYGTSVAEIQAAKDKSEIAINEIDVQGIAGFGQLATQYCLYSCFRQALMFGKNV